MSQPSSLPPHLNPLWYRGIKSLDRVAHRVGVARPLSAERLMQRALKSQRREGFSDNSFEPGLEALLSAANGEAQLNGFGRFMLYNLVSILLRQRLRVEAWRESHADVAAQRIQRPLIIAGLPRTGTTFLHQLLAQDPQFRAPRTFEIDRPVPPPLEGAIDHDPRVKNVQRGIDVIHRIVPHFQAIHPIAARTPDECQQITSYQFSSIGFQHILEIPTFRQWLLGHDFRRDLEFHYRFLQHLQSAWQRERWLLKSPAHVQYLPTLLQVYPDAMIIHTHRNPQEVMGSVSSLSWTMQDVFSDKADPLVSGRGQLDFWSSVTEICLQDRQHLGNTKAIFDMRYPELVSDPVALVQRIYQHFELELTPFAETAMRNFVAANGQHKQGSHKYDPREFGVDQLQDIDVYQRYRQRFDV